MADFKEYIATEGTCGAVSDGELDELIGRYEWFSTARVVRSHLRGAASPRLAIVAACRACSSLELLPVEMQGAADDEEMLIDRFLRLDNYRIVADGDGADEQIRTEAQLSDEDDVVSEELAEIYLSQGMKAEAEAIYRKLSLLNPEKSVYFAELIGKMNKTE